MKLKPNSYQLYYIKINFWLYFNYFIRYVEDNKTKFVETLSQAVAIKSISADSELRNEVYKMMQWALVKLKALGAEVELCDIGQQVLIK